MHDSKYIYNVSLILFSLKSYTITFMKQGKGKKSAKHHHIKAHFKKEKYENLVPCVLWGRQILKKKTKKKKKPSSHIQRIFDTINLF